MSNLGPSSRGRHMTGFGSMIALGLLLAGALPGRATPPPFTITIDSGAPYYQPAVAQVLTGVPIRWQNPTASHHTVTHDGCATEGPCVFDSGSVPPNGSYTVPGLRPGRYPYHSLPLAPDHARRPDRGRDAGVVRTNVNRLPGPPHHLASPAVFCVPLPRTRSFLFREGHVCFTTAILAELG